MRQIVKIASVLSVALWITACGEEQASGQPAATSTEVG